MILTYLYTRDHGQGPEFYDALREMCERLEVPSPVDMLSVWMSESGVKADAHNPRGDASGLNQIMPYIARKIGWDVTDTTLARYRTLTATEQLPLVEKFYKPYRGFLLSIAHIY